MEHVATQSSRFHHRVRDLEMRLDSLREYAIRQQDETLQAWVRGLAVPLLGPQRAISSAWRWPLLALVAGAAVFAFLAGLAVSGRG